MSRTDRMPRVRHTCLCVRLETPAIGPRPELPADRKVIDKPLRDWKGTQEMHWASVVRNCVLCGGKAWR